MTKRLATTAPARETWILGINSVLPHAYSVVLGDEGDDLSREIEQAEAYYRQHEPGALPVQIMTPEQFDAWEEGRMQARSRLEACSIARFEEMLGALPPLEYDGRDGFDRFLVGEPTHGSWHQQYARVGERCATRLVDRFAPQTWITEADVLAINEEA